jgi:hypothetical protein
MITLRIGTETRALADASESWITDQLNRRRGAGQAVCVEVAINTSGLNLRLATAACGGAGGGGRAPNANEARIFEVWESKGLSSGGFTGGELVAFLKQLRRLIA